MTQIESAKKGKITPEMEFIAKEEGLPAKYIRDGVAEGKIVILCNKKHPPKHIVAVGESLRTKVNSNIGSSTELYSIKDEIEKAKVSETAGADTIMDLSTGGKIREIRRKIRENFRGPLGTVPIYEAAIETVNEKGGIIFMTPEKIFDVIRRHAEDGVDFITVHVGVTRDTLKTLQVEKRVTDVVSRGGAFLITWMVANKKENPLYEHYDKLLEIAKEYDITLSLGDGFRPGSIADSTDRVQVHELSILGELKEVANRAGVQVMIEGPGHIPLNEVKTNVLLEKKLCHSAPFYVLGPVVTDIAPGYDEITSAIGGAIAAGAGADFLCYVTPSEHIGLPTKEEVRRGVIATRIAAHVGDIVKGVKGADLWDREMSKARKRLDWKKQIELAIDPEWLKKARAGRSSKVPDTCSMCGEYCAIKLVEDALRMK